MIIFKLMLSLLASFSIVNASKPDHLDFNVDLTPYNAKNVKKLYEITKADYKRLTDQLYYEIPQYFKLYTDQKEVITDVCNKAQGLNMFNNFLQTNIKSNEAQQINLRLMELKKKVKNMETSDLELMIKEKLGTLTDSVETLSTEKVTLGDVKNTCQRILAICNEAIDYLNYLRDELNYWINIVQVRIDQMDNFIASHSTTYLESGRFNKILGSSDVLNSKDVTKSRKYQTYKISFDKPFESMPQVAIALTGFDSLKSYPSIYADIQSIGLDHFILLMSTEGNSSVNAFQVDFIAFDPNYVPAKAIAVKTDRTSNPNMRSTSVYFDVPKSYKSASFATALSGISFDDSYAKAASGFYFRADMCGNYVYCVGFNLFTMGSINNISTYVIMFNNQDVYSTTVTTMSALQSIPFEYSDSNIIIMKCPSGIYKYWSGISYMERIRNTAFRYFETFEGEGTSYSVKIQTNPNEQSFKYVHYNVVAFCYPGN